jgi:hypothetical protein
MRRVEVFTNDELLMTLGSKLWRVGAALFVLINVAGVGYAAALGEQLHAGVHVGLLVLGVGAYLVWRGAPQARRRDLQPQQADERLEYLQQSVDAVALEVERIGEKQRFSDKLRAEGETPPTKKDQ